MQGVEQRRYRETVRWTVSTADDQGASSAASRPPNCPDRGTFLLWDKSEGGRTGAGVNGLPVETNAAPARAVAAGGLRRRPPSCEDGAATSFPEQPFGRFVNRPYGCVRDGGSKSPRPTGMRAVSADCENGRIWNPPLRVCAGRREQKPRESSIRRSFSSSATRRRFRVAKPKNFPALRVCAPFGADCDLFSPLYFFIFP